MSKKVNRKVPELRFPKFGDNWKISTIGEIASVSSGGTPSRTESTYWNGDIPSLTRDDRVKNTSPYSALFLLNS